MQPTLAQDYFTFLYADGREAQVSANIPGQHNTSNEVLKAAIKCPKVCAFKLGDAPSRTYLGIPYSVAHLERLSDRELKKRQMTRESISAAKETGASLVVQTRNHEIYPLRDGDSVYNPERKGCALALV